MQLKTYLGKQGISAAEFARRVAVSRATVTRWCKDDRLPSLAAMRRIIAATNGSVGLADFPTKRDG